MYVQSIQVDDHTYMGFHAQCVGTWGLGGMSALEKKKSFLKALGHDIILQGYFSVAHDITAPIRLKSGSHFSVNGCSSRWQNAIARKRV